MIDCCNRPVLILTGPPGAGKTTVARVLAGRRERAVHLESDRFFQFIESGYVEPWKPESHAQNEVVMGIVARAAATYADAGYFTVIDGIVIPRWFLQPLRENLADAGHAVAYAVLRPSLEVCLARAAARSTGSLADTAVIEQLWRQFSDLGHLERHLIENGARSPEQVADLLDPRLTDDLLLA